jgi:hypothetical protein
MYPIIPEATRVSEGKACGQVFAMASEVVKLEYLYNEIASIREHVYLGLDRR